MRKAEFEKLRDNLGVGEELIKYMLEVSEANRTNPSQALVVRIRDLEVLADDRMWSVNSSPWVTCEDNHYLKSKSHEKIVEFQLFNVKGESTLDSVFGRTSYNWVPHLSYEGFVLAGGSIINMLIERHGYNKGDFDFYPVYPNGEARKVEMSYRKFLSEIDNFPEFPQKGKYAKDKFFTATIKPETVVRGEHCTSILADKFYFVETEQWAKFGKSYDIQIIHRGHPSPVSVVASFDQMCCRVFYDGEDFYATVEAALCLVHRINPIDWRRESPTHVHRAIKYQHRGFRIVCPGVLKSNIDAKDTVEFDVKFAGNTGGIVFDETKFTVGQTLGSDDDDVEDSDYLQEMEDPNCLSVTYGGLGRAIRLDRPIPYIVTETCMESIDGCQPLDLRGTLSKLIGGHKQDNYSYFDEDAERRFQEIQDRIKSMAVSYSGGTKGKSRIKCMSESQLAEFSGLQNEMNAILDQHVQKYDHLLNKQRELCEKGVVFELANPGKQFTGSFQPIVRNGPQDYWGPVYVDFEHRRFWKAKLSLLCIMKFHGRGVYGITDLKRLIIGYVTRMWFRMLSA